MPRYGFSGTGPDMRKLILHVLAEMGEAVSERELVGLALLDDNSDYFMYSDALEGVVSASLAGRSDGFIYLTPRGLEVAAVIERELPSALRRAVVRACEGVRERQLGERCVHTETDGNDVRCLLTDGSTALLDLRIQTGGPQQAKAFAKRFSKDAGIILERIWEIFTL